MTIRALDRLVARIGELEVAEEGFTRAFEARHREPHEGEDEVLADAAAWRTLLTLRTILSSPEILPEEAPTP